jgi:hypothetical protein
MAAYGADAILAETISITGHGGDQIEAYRAVPLGPGTRGALSSSITCRATTGKPRSSSGASP